MKRVANLSVGLFAAVGFVACSGDSGSPAAPSAFPSGAGTTTIAGTAHSAGASAALGLGDLSHSESSGPLEVCVVGTETCAVADVTGYFELVDDFVNDVQLHFSGDGHDVVVTIHDVQPGQTVTVTVTLNGHTATLDVESQQDAGERIALCHREGNGQYHRIEVASSAVEAHGDGYPLKEVPGTEPPLLFDADCRILGPQVDIEKTTNGEDADRGTGPKVLVGDPVVWTYIVTNTGTVELSVVAVEDDDSSIVLNCEVPIPATLQPGASFECTAAVTAVDGQYTNVGTVAATDGVVKVTDSDTSHYLGYQEVDDEEDDPDSDAKVELCHRTGNGRYNLIRVSVNAEPAHLAHGDVHPVDGSCPVSASE